MIVLIMNFKQHVQFIKGANIIIACRNLEKGDKAVNNIKQLAGNENIKAEYLDLSDLSTVIAFSKKINSELDKLDILINNAGIMVCPEWRTKDGFEMQFGTNHLGESLN